MCEFFSEMVLSLKQRFFPNALNWKNIKMAVTVDVSLTLYIKDSIYIYILWKEGKDYISS